MSFYRIPAVIHNQGPKWKLLSSDRRTSWLAAINRGDWTPNDLSRVCSEHFLSGKPAHLYDRANPDWTPHINMGYSRKGSPDEARYLRSVARSQARALADVATESLVENDDDLGDHNPNGERMKAVIMTLITTT